MARLLLCDEQAVHVPTCCWQPDRSIDNVHRCEPDFHGCAVGQGVDELLVVTLVVASEQALSLPSIRSPEDLRTALQALGGISASQVLAMELLWTPQAENDYFTRDEVISDYPGLVPL